MPGLQPHPREATLGFVILSHTSSPLLGRLLSRLNQEYAAPPIVIHHDFSQAPLPLSPSGLTQNISVVRPHIETSWGRFSLVEAFLRGLEELYDRHTPDWFANLSTSCYPVSSARAVLGELEQSPYDAFIGSVELYPQMKIPDSASTLSMGEILLSPSLPTHASDVAAWMHACYRRYVSKDRGGNVFGPSFGCFAGDQWFTANAKAASMLLASRQAYPDVVRHYRGVHVPDESFCQTILCNQPELKICPSNRRFVDWHTPKAHPVDLTVSDFPRLVEARCHFARKVSQQGSSLLDVLDRWRATGVVIPPDTHPSEASVNETAEPPVTQSKQH